MIKKLFAILFCFTLSLYGQSIAEKKAGLATGGSDLTQELQTFLDQVNRELEESQKELALLYGRVEELYKENAPEESYRSLLNQINDVRTRSNSLQASWREMSAKSSVEESYALWHQPETTLGQIIIDYGSNNYVYLVPPEVAEIQLHVDSNLPVPRASWSEMLELILSQNGVGIKQLNPYVRQLFLVKEDKSNLALITNNRCDLECLRPDTRICFVLSPEPAEVRRTWAFLDKFTNPNTTVLQMVGRDIIIVAQVCEIQDLLKLNDFVSTNRGDKEYKVISLWRVKAEEMARILGAIFDHLEDEAETAGDEDSVNRSATGDANGLKIIPLSQIAQAIFLVGTIEEIKKAEDIIEQVEGQVGGAKAKEIFWYTAKNSDAEELANVVSKIYELMVANRDNGQEKDENQPDIVAVPIPPPPAPFAPSPNPVQPFPPRNIYEDGFFLNDRYVVDDSPVEINRTNYANLNRNNFIVDVKTGSIVMVVEADILPQIKDLLRKLDVPKKMVQIEVLLFEKRTKRENEFGLNLLRIGEKACNKNLTSFLFNDICGCPENRGVSEFFIGRKKNDSFPAFDAMYKFLLTQDDIQINANPSVLTINQTPAKIAIEDEISVNTGVFEVETNKGVTLKDAFARARYGIKMEITPTVHMHCDEEDGDPVDYVTLVTDVVFETIHPCHNKSRPDVTRRLINNEARVADGQTVILGGLRRKMIDDRKESIPFIGELPGIGKLFSTTSLHDNTTEMFIFITPKIIDDPSVDLERIRLQETCRRPGDVPHFLCCLAKAQEYDKNRLLYGSLTMLLGRPPVKCEPAICGEYDGR